MTGAATSRFEGKVALVTGAARGQGRSHCLRLAEEDAAVIAVDACEPFEVVQYPQASSADLAETVRLVEERGGAILPAQADVRDGEALAAAVAAGVERFGGLDVVLANAGIISYPGSALDLSDTEWRDVLDIDLTGVWNTCRLSLPHLIERGGGAIVLTSSMAGLKGYGGVPHYSAAKHGVVGLGRSLAVEFAAHKVRVNTVHPTTVDTDMIRAPQMARMFRPDLDDPGFEDMKAVASGMHLLREPWIESADVTACVLFLASEEARALTGVALPVDLGAATK